VRQVGVALGAPGRDAAHPGAARGGGVGQPALDQGGLAAAAAERRQCRGSGEVGEAVAGQEQHRRRGRTAVHGRQVRQHDWIESAKPPLSPRHLAAIRQFRYAYNQGEYAVRRQDEAA
jgi:hypothetical protein